jgi:hypothetical protein
MGDGHPYDQQQEISVAEDGQKLVTSEDFEVRIIEPAQPGGNWEAKAAIKMHMTENALTVRIVSIKVSIFPQYLDLPLTSRFILISGSNVIKSVHKWRRLPPEYCLRQEWCLCMCNGYCYQDSNLLGFVSLSNVDSEIHFDFLLIDTRLYKF